MGKLAPATPPLPGSVSGTEPHRSIFFVAIFVTRSFFQKKSNQI